jgi:cell fate (sporulation/competence/biofilm development) regulator YlbF (YheA/YmcA/DUF963 family)
MKLEAAHAVEFTNLAEYIDRLLEYTNTTPTQQCCRQLDTSKQKYRETRKMKNSITEKTKQKWHEKRMHGQWPRSLDEKLMDIEQSYRWLKYGTLTLSLPN